MSTRPPGTGPVKKPATGPIKKRPGSAPLGRPADLKAAIMSGVDQVKANPAVLVGGVVAIGGVSLLINVVGMLLGPLALLLFPVSLVASTYLGANFMQMALALHDGRPAALGDLFVPNARFVPFLVASLLMGLAISIGSSFLVIPGIIAMALLMFAPMLAIDKSLGGLDALQRSVAITKPHLMDLAIFSLALGALNFVGSLLLGLGLLVTIPISMMATVRMYRSFVGA